MHCVPTTNMGCERVSAAYSITLPFLQYYGFSVYNGQDFMNWFILSCRATHDIAENALYNGFIMVAEGATRQYEASREIFFPPAQTVNEGHASYRYVMLVLACNAWMSTLAQGLSMSACASKLSINLLCSDELSQVS